MHKIHIVSSNEPNGVTWLLNVLLELGFKIDHDNPTGIWTYDSLNHVYSLNPDYLYLVKYLPSLNSKKYFTFNEQVMFTWSHKWIFEKFEEGEFLVFIRDPRDSMFSSYRREQCTKQYMKFIDALTGPYLLRRLNNWTLFYSLWLTRDHVNLVKFEDCKQNPLDVVHKLLKTIAVTKSEKEILAAVEASSFNNAKDVENEYAKNSNSKLERTVINKGIANEWKTSSHRARENLFIEVQCQKVMMHVGYLLGEEASNLSLISQVNHQNSTQGPNIQFRDIVAQGTIKYNGVKPSEILEYIRHENGIGMRRNLGNILALTIEISRARSSNGKFLALILSKLASLLNRVMIGFRNIR